MRARAPILPGFEAARLMDAMFRDGNQREPREIVVPVLGIKSRASTDTLAAADEDVKAAVRAVLPSA
jgi:hypothetical protein